MLSPEIARRVDRLCAAREHGVLQPSEFAARLGEWVTADNLGDVLEQLPPSVRAEFGELLSIDDRRAMDGENLVPEGSPFGLTPYLTDYHLAVAVALTPREAGQLPLLTVVCLPSFEPEWAVRMFKEEAGNVLVLTTPHKRLHGAKDRSAVIVQRSEAALDRPLAAQLHDVWQKMLRRTRHPRHRQGGIDGVNYHFACHEPGGPQMAGWVRLDDPNTAPGRLAALSYSLARYIVSDDRARPDVLGSIRESVAWFLALS